MSESRLVVGLGNPEKQYQFTRHNLGFLVLTKLAEVLEVEFSTCSFTKALIAEGTREEIDFCLLMPMAYMNNSGAAVKAAMEQKQFSLDQTLVVSDDFNLDFRKMRIRAKGSDGGHNGMGSVIEKLGDENFARLRLGIGLPANIKDPVEYVLKEFKKEERSQLDSFIELAVECIFVWMHQGVETAMDQFNKRKR